ncbi:unnamed protein product [Clavelina lepadiformis]|uniref:Uncharacterized protein n=1 Tax=Clavelina lepadiformis TaxID=159417 RepID=A0ABP0GMU5_CLALP
MKRHIFGIIFIATTAVSCDALRCFQCEIRFSLDSPVDTCIGQNATTCPEEAKFCITNTSASIASTSDILGCHIGNNSFQDCRLAGDDEVHCSVTCDTDGCNSPYPTYEEVPPLGPDIVPPIPRIPPSLPPFSTDVQTSPIGPTNVIPPGVVPSFQPQPQPDTGDIGFLLGTDIIPPQTSPGVAPQPQTTAGIELERAVGELSCFQCSILNFDTLPFPLDECEGAFPRPCPATEDNYCVIITTTEPGISSVVRACDANIATTSCTTVGQVRTCAEYCSTGGCNSLEGIIQEATTVSDAGMQGGEGGGDGCAAKKVQISHFSLLNIVLDHATRTSGGSETINEASLFNKVIGLLKKLL